MKDPFDMRRTRYIDYVNYRGERSVRLITIQRIYWGSTEYHPAPGIMIEAFDHAKNAFRDFAWRDIQAWEYRNF